MKRKPPTRRKRNPAEESPAIAAAAEMSADFHGREAREVKVYAESEASYPALAGLGVLVALQVYTESGSFRLPFTAAGVQLACTPDGLNLHFVGGDQELDLESLGIETNKDQIELGACTHIVYCTKKGFHNFVKTDYVHEFGEESGELPMLGYSPLNRKLYLSGGAYHVAPEGIVD